MQSVSSWIWTRFTVSISYDDNYYTRGTLKSINQSSAEDGISLFLAKLVGRELFSTSVIHFSEQDIEVIWLLLPVTSSASIKQSW